MRFSYAMWCAALPPQPAAGLLAFHLMSSSGIGGGIIAKAEPHAGVCINVRCFVVPACAESVYSHVQCTRLPTRLLLLYQ